MFPTIARRSCLRYVPTFPTIAHSLLAYGANVSYDSTKVLPTVPTFPTIARRSQYSFASSRRSACTLRERTRVHVREIRFGDYYIHADNVRPRTANRRLRVDNVRRAANETLGWHANVYLQICWGILQLSQNPNVISPSKLHRQSPSV